MTVLTFNLECNRFFHLAHLKGDSPPILRCQVLQHELVNLPLVSDGVDFISEEHLVIQKPLRLFVCIVNLTCEHCVAVFINLCVSQVLGDFNFTHYIERNKTVVLVRM